MLADIHMEIVDIILFNVKQLPMVIKVGMIVRGNDIMFH
jgi:hypothetical protein